jgi:hypothetical protein
LGEECRAVWDDGQQQPTTISIADELAKLAKLKEQGVISESEFQQMKQDLLKRT